MMGDKMHFAKFAGNYINTLSRTFDNQIILSIELLARDLLDAWIEEKQVFICGNGGSAGNSIHMANDFIYGVGACGGGKRKVGMRVESLAANSAVITCLANDTGFENIFSSQIEVKANEEDLLIVLSGSGNSENVVNAISTAKRLGVKTYAVTGFSGGVCREIADSSIHFEVNDMQIAEDAQLIVGHLCMQWLNMKRHLVPDV
jgi:D-sedoheptulose 7-phosphate isomerase